MSRAEILEAYYAAEEAWKQASESTSHGLSPEEYAERHPRPTLKAFLTGGKTR